jgi:hypothetical protein
VAHGFNFLVLEEIDIVEEACSLSLFIDSIK